MSLRVWRFAGAVLLVGGGLACGPAVDLDDASGSGSSDATADGTTGAGTAETSMGPTSAGPTSMGPTSVGPTSDDGSEATDATGSPVACPPVPEHGCDGPIDCRGQQCGRPNSPYDVDGCLRFRCDGPEDCASGEVCHRPLDWGGCVSSGWSCEEDPELGCICGGRADCGGSYCLPADQVPPVHCTELTSAPECLDAGCGPFVTGRPITDAGGGSCLCDLPMEYCVFVPEGTVPTPVPTPYLAPELGAVIKLPQRYEPPPFGWVPCDELPDVALCQCAMALPCEL